MFPAAVERNTRNTDDHPWIDSGLRASTKHKDKQRQKALKTPKAKDWNLFKKFRWELNILINKKKFDHATKLKSSFYDNPKRF